MSEKRMGAASIVLNQTTLWITGGDNSDLASNFFLASSEFLTLSGTMPGPELPLPLYAHCMVAINNTFSMVVGGLKSDDYVSGLTFFYHHQEQKWINGSNLLEGRMRHAAGIVNDTVTKETFVVVTGGNQYGKFMSSTEIFFDNQWNPGK